jgi:hypothetical protein
MCRDSLCFSLFACIWLCFVWLKCIYFTRTYRNYIVKLLCVLSTYQFLLGFQCNFLIFRFSQFVVYSLSVKMEAVCSSETSVNFYRITRRHIPEDSTCCKGMHNKSVNFIIQITHSNIINSVSKVKPEDLVLRFGCDIRKWNFHLIILKRFKLWKRMR